jgi:hypothetical protein
MDFVKDGTFSRYLVVGMRNNENAEEIRRKGFGLEYFVV